LRRPWSRNSRARLTAARNSQSLASCSLAICQSFAIEFLGGFGMPLAQQKPPLAPVQFRCEPARPGPVRALQGIVQLGHGLLDLPGDLACPGEEAEKIGHPYLRPGGAVSRRAAAQKRYPLRRVATFDGDPPVNGKPRSVAKAMSSSARSFRAESAPASERSRQLLAKLAAKVGG